MTYTRDMLFTLLLPACEVPTTSTEVPWAPAEIPMGPGRLPAFGGCEESTIRYGNEEEEAQGEPDATKVVRYDDEERAVLNTIKYLGNSTEAYEQAWTYDDSGCMTTYAQVWWYDEDPPYEERIRETTCDEFGYPLRAVTTYAYDGEIAFTLDVEYLNVVEQGLLAMRHELTTELPAGDTEFLQYEYDWVDGFITRIDESDGSELELHYEAINDEYGQPTWRLEQRSGGTPSYLSIERDEYGRALAYRTASDAEFSDEALFATDEWEQDRYVLSLELQYAYGSEYAGLAFAQTCTEDWPWSCRQLRYTPATDDSDAGPISEVYQREWSCP